MTKKSLVLTPLKIWMRSATQSEQLKLARLAGTSRGTLYQLANGTRGALPGKARLIEAATEKLHKSSKGRLPRLYRTDLSKDCAGCEFARKCLGADVTTRADFEYLHDDDTAGE